MIVAVVLSRSLGGKGRSASSPNDVVRSRKQIRSKEQSLVGTVSKRGIQHRGQECAFPGLPTFVDDYLNWKEVRTSNLRFSSQLQYSEIHLTLRASIISLSRDTPARVRVIERKFGENPQPCMRKGGHIGRVFSGADMTRGCTNMKQ